METDGFIVEVPLGAFVGFLKAARVGKKLGKRNIAREEIELRLSGQCLLVSIVGVTHELPASGRWPRAVRVGLAAMQRLVKIPPTQNPLLLRVQGAKLHIGTTVFAADIEH